MSFLYLTLTYNNPIVHTFVNVMSESIKKKRKNMLLSMRSVKVENLGKLGKSKSSSNLPILHNNSNCYNDVKALYCCIEGGI